MLSIAERKRFETHFQEKIANREWLADCLGENGTMNPDSFPYEIKENGKATTTTAIFSPTYGNTLFPNAQDTGEPHYIVNIPMVSSSSKEILNLVNLLKYESFGKTSMESMKTVRERMAVVIGVNRFHSIDPEINRHFKSFIENLSTIRNIALRIFGFFWQPIWEKKATAPKKIYERNLAFRILKGLSPSAAHAVRSVREKGESLSDNLASQIPYTHIRQKILKSNATAEFVARAELKSPIAPIYLATMDSDVTELRYKRIGLYSRYDEEIENELFPFAVTFGYRAPDDENPVIRLGMKLDWAVRAAMNEAIPFSAYLPEPSTIFRIRHPEYPSDLPWMSFLGDGPRLENRRMVQNCKKIQFPDDNVVVRCEGGPAMGTPERMHTKKQEKRKSLSPANIKTKDVLTSLRGLPQSHAFPLEWAGQVYSALGFSTSHVHLAKQPIAWILSIYDPISRMFVAPGRYSAKTFDTIISTYETAPLTEEQNTLLNTAKAALAKIKMPPEKIDQVEEAAKASGSAIHLVLKEATAG